MLPVEIFRGKEGRHFSSCGLVLVDLWLVSTMGKLLKLDKTIIAIVETVSMLMYVPLLLAYSSQFAKDLRSKRSYLESRALDAERPTERGKELFSRC